VVAAGVGGYFAFHQLTEHAPPVPNEQPASGPPATPPSALDTQPAAKKTVIEVGGPVGSVAVSPEGRWLAVGLIDPVNRRGGVKLFDRRAGGTPAWEEGARESCESVAISPDGRYLACALGTARRFCVYDLRAGQVVNVKDSFPVNGHPRAVAFSTDSKQLAVSVIHRGFEGGAPTLTGGVRLWRTDAWDVAPQVLKSDGGRALAFTPDGTLVAAVTEDLPRSIRLWSAATGTPVTPDWSGLDREAPKTSEDVGPSVACARDRALLAFSICELIRVCEPPWYTARGPVIRARAEPRVLALSPDGSVLAAGVGNAVVLWDVKTGALRGTHTGHAGDVLALAFSADGSALYSGASEDRVVRIWDVPPP
jgi:WD40 repeat protein